MTIVRRLPPPVIALLVVVLSALFVSRSEAAPRWIWPLGGAVTRGFERPASAWAAGHRGIDIEAGIGATVRAPVAATVTFVGPVGGRGVIVLSTPYDDDITLEPVDALVVRGDVVEPGDPVALLRSGHDGGTVLHFGVRVHGEYVDPLELLPAQPRIVVYDSHVESW